MFGVLSVAVILLAGCQINLAKHLSTRITDGRPAKIEDFPYTVSIRYNNLHFCGGAIISESYIITAAQCLMGFFPKDLTVLAGYTWLNATNDKAIKVIDVYRHPRFNGRDYDIGIVKLAEYLIFSKDIGKVELPTANQTIPNFFMAFVSGWGYLLFNSTSYSPVLNAELIQTADHAVCKKVMVDVTDRMFCLGYYQQSPIDSCIGDTGGPVTARTKSILIGIISWGIGCGVNGQLGVNTRVAEAEIRSFIKDVSGL